MSERELIQIAAKLARCEPLYALDAMLENPRLYRGRLRKALDKAESDLKTMAIQLRDISSTYRAAASIGKAQGGE